MFNGYRIIGLCITKIGNEEYYNFIRVFNETAVKNGYRLFIYQMSSDMIGDSLGYGSDKGGEMRVKYSATSEEYELLTYYDDHYNLITPKSYIDEKNLNAVADDLGIDYYHMDSDKDTEKMIDEMLSKIENGDFSKSQETGEGYDEIYWIFALALAGFLLIDFIYYRLFFGKER